jgi:hypothetical protein
LSDDDSTTGGESGASGTDPTFAPAVGLSEIEFCRFVLETCESVDDALDAVQLARHYYFLHPQHFLVADRDGRAFVYEFAAGHNTEHVTWADDLQIVTNHMLFRYPTIADLPLGDGSAGTYSRFRNLTTLFADTDRFSKDEIVARHASARFTDPGVPVRTLWHVLYDTERRTMDVTFHLRDGEDGDVRTPRMRFALDTTR